MKIAIMQPYLFPYIGYFQLIGAVDTFVIYDDVNYITKGWINRNRILLNRKAHLFTLSLEKASQNRLINEITIIDNEKNRKNLLNILKHAYVKSPEYETVYPLLTDIILNKENNLSKYIEYSLKQITNFLSINTTFIYSSVISKDNSLKGQDKIIEICKKMCANIYINPIGGIKLYNKEEFSRNNIKLFFLETDQIQYKQFKNDFIPYLSIIDMLMFNSREKIKGYLKDYRLI